MTVTDDGTGPLHRLSIGPAPGRSATFCEAGSPRSTVASGVNGGPRPASVDWRQDEGVRILALAAMTVVPLLVVGFVVRREQVQRARLDRGGLDDLRRIYRRDNPRGTGLEPLKRDQQPRVRAEHRGGRGPERPDAA